MSAATSNNKGLLETLPPIVPSIGFTKGQKHPSTAEDNTTTTKNDDDTKDTSNEPVQQMQLDRIAVLSLLISLWELAFAFFTKVGIFRPIVRRVLYTSLCTTPITLI